jgi:hypothetical protein
VSGGGRRVGALAAAVLIAVTGVAVGSAGAEPARSAEPVHEGLGAAEVQALLERGQASGSPSGQARGEASGEARDLFGANGESGPCDQAPYTDTRGDGTIDIVKVSVISNCLKWRWVVHLDRPIDFINSNAMYIEFDMDNNLDNGCGGTDFLAAVYGVPGSYPRNELYRTRSCDDSTWDLLYPGVMVGLVGSTVVFDMPHEYVPSTTFRWYVTMLPNGNDAGRDHAPNGVWRQAVFPPWANKVRVGSVRDGSAVVRWSIPPDVSGLRLRAYDVQYRVEGRGPWTTRVVKASRPPMLTISGLELGRFHEVRVASRNAQGRSEWSKETSFFVKGPPSEVRRLRSSFTPHAGEYAVRWTPPRFFGGAALVNYRVTVAKDGGPEVVKYDKVDSRWMRVGNEPGTYVVSVQPITKIGQGPVSTIEFVIPPADPPTDPPAD